MPISVLVISYLSAALSFLVVGVLLIASQGRQKAGWLIAACFGTVLWAVMVGLEDSSSLSLTLGTEWSEVARGGLWLIFLRKIFWRAHQAVENLSSRSDRVQYFLIGFIALQLGWSGYLHTLPEVSVTWAFRADVILHVILTVMVMMLVEQLFRNVHVDARWGIKFLCLAIGVQYAYDFFLYANATLLQFINPNVWLARGFVVAFSAPLILVSAVRNQDWILRLRVSRHVVLNTVSLFGAGSYLIVMSLVGYYLRMFGGTWGSVLQIVFLIGAVLLLAVILFSGRFRAKFRVTVSKHFFRYRYDYREEWLRFTRTLLASQTNAEIYRAAIEAVAVLVESPSGVLWLADETKSGYLCQASWGTPSRSDMVPKDDPLVQFMERTQWVVDLDDYPPELERSDGGSVSEWLSTGDPWLVVPLLIYDGMIGFVVLAKPRTKVVFDWEVSDLIKAAAHQLASHLAQKRATDALMVARQFESFNRMSAFIVHDLKNLVAQLSLMLSNAEKYKDNPEFQADMLATVENSVSRMRRLLLQIGNPNEDLSQRQQLDISKLLSDVLREKSMYKPRPVLVGMSDVWVEADPEKLTRVLGHVVQNACEATSHTGKVVLRMECQDRDVFLYVEDTGEGMDEDFMREQLFKPFNSTKKSGMGVGVHECREYVRQLGGDVSVTSTKGQGTSFGIRLPRAIVRERADG